MRTDERASSLFSISEKIYGSDEGRPDLISKLPVMDGESHPLFMLALSQGYGLEDLALAIYQNPYFESRHFQTTETFDGLDKNLFIRNFVRAYSRPPKERDCESEEAAHSRWVSSFPPPDQIERICIFLGLHPIDILPRGWNDPLPPNLLRLHKRMRDDETGKYKELYRELSGDAITEELSQAKQFCEDNLHNNDHFGFLTEVSEKWQKRDTEEVVYDSATGDIESALKADGTRRYLSDIFDPANNGDAYFASEYVEEEQDTQILHYFDWQDQEIATIRGNVERLTRQKNKILNAVHSDISFIYETDDPKDELKEINSLWVSLCSRKDNIAFPSAGKSTIKDIFYSYLEGCPEEFGVTSEEFDECSAVEVRLIMHRMGENILDYHRVYNQLKQAATSLKKLQDISENEFYREMGNGSFLKRAYLRNLVIIDDIEPVEDFGRQVEMKALPSPGTLSHYNPEQYPQGNLPALTHKPSGHSGPN